LGSPVCFIINKPSVGGAEIFLLNLGKYMSKEFDCHIIFLFPGGEMLDKFRESGCKVHCLNFTWNPLGFLKQFKLLRVKIQEIKPEVVHTWLYISDLIGGTAASFEKVSRIFWSIRQSNISFSQNKLHTFLFIRLCGLLSNNIPHKIISCSNVAMMNHVNFAFYNKSKIEVIPNGYKTEELMFSDSARAALRSELNCTSKIKLVGIIGRYDIQKGFDNFIDVSSYINVANENCLFVFIGSGCDVSNHELVGQIEAKLSSEKYLLLGQRSDMKNIMCGLDLLLVTSRGEAFPNVLAEAMCYGLPVVTTNVGEIPIILDGICKIYNPGQNREMANAAIQILDFTDEEKATFSEKLRERIHQRYEFEDVMKRFRNTYLLTSNQP
jgi:glycosyltransferase involved in cell wall biosynthesis